MPVETGKRVRGGSLGSNSCPPSPTNITCIFVEVYYGQVDIYVIIW